MTKNLRIKYICLTLSMVVLCSACSRQNTPTANASSHVSSDIEQPVKAEIDVVTDYIQTAFDYDISNISPQVNKDNDTTEYKFYPSENDLNNVFIVSLSESEKYPSVLYHFDHPNDVAQIDIAKDKDFVFDESMIDTAKEFVENLYGINCSDVPIIAYGYQNKVAVQFAVSDSDFFDVRFFYKESAPIGCYYFCTKEQAEYTKEYYQAVVFYES